MPSVNLTAADDVADLGAQSWGNGLNEFTQNFVNTNSCTDLVQRVIASTSDDVRSVAFLRFPYTPTDTSGGVFSESLRSARLIVNSTNASFDDFHFTVKGWKVAHGGTRVTDAMIGTTAKPSYWYANQGTTATWTVSVSNVSTLTDGRPYIVADPDGHLLDILNEIMAQGTWELGDALTLLFMASNSAPDSGTEGGWTTAGSDVFGFPALLLDYGPVDNGGQDVDLILGPADSTVAFHDQPGGERDFTFPVFMPNVVFHDGPLGESASGTIVGDIYGGDNFRGLTQNGCLYDVISARYPGTQYIQSCFAIVQTTAQGWAGQIAVTDGGYWGDPASEGSLRWTLANPRSVSERQVVKMNLGANDLIALGQSEFGAGGYLLGADDPAYVTGTIIPRWDAYVASNIRPALIACIEEVLDNAKDLTKIWIWLQGYHNLSFMMEPLGPAQVAFASSNTHSYKRQVHAAQGAGIGYAQAYMDMFSQDNTGVGRGGHAITPTSVGEMAYQSATIQFAADFQQKNDPTGAGVGAIGSDQYNPNLDSFNYALTFGIGFPLLGVFAHDFWAYTLGGGPGMFRSLSGWEFGMRNLTDITVNRVINGCLRPLFEEMESTYDQVIYTPAYDALPAGPYSDDPDSEFAGWDPDYSHDGIHLNKEGVYAWYRSLDGPVTQIASALPEIFRELPPQSYPLGRKPPIRRGYR